MSIVNESLLEQTVLEWLKGIGCQTILGPDISVDGPVCERENCSPLRLDYGGPLHRNPDGEEIPCPHLHIYREGYGDKWAVPIPTQDSPNIHDHWQTLQDFMRYCNPLQTNLKSRKGYLHDRRN